YIKDGKLHDSFGKVIDENIFDDDGKSQTLLTKVLAADSVWGGEKMSHFWTADIKLDGDGNPVAILTCRANDEPENTNFDDRRLFYARFDGSKWHTHHLAKAGPCLWKAEQDYTGLGAVHPFDANTVYISTPIDPMSGAKLAHHEIFKGM